MRRSTRYANAFLSAQQVPTVVCVYYEEQRKFEMLTAVGPPQYCKTRMDKLADSVLHQRATCTRCVDRHYSQLNALRLKGRNPKRTYRTMRRHLAQLRVSSSKAERKHLVGQEARPKKRGKIIGKTVLATCTYGACVRGDFEAKKENA